MGDRKGRHSDSEEFRSGFVCLAGRPNVGKSTLLNRLVGKKISITSDKPQTTRNRIMGIQHGAGFQVVFMDTPGIHQARSPLNQRMVSYATAALSDADLTLVLFEAGRKLEPDGLLVLERVRACKRPLFLVLNKTDLAGESEVLESLREFGEMNLFQEIVPISALTGKGVENLGELIVDRLQPGPPYFEEGQSTGQSEELLIAEFVRQEIFHRTGQEVPYKTAVRVERMVEVPSKLVVEASIFVERDSQKGILIGKGGRMLKSIGSAARKKLERLFGVPIYLELHVRVLKRWSENPRYLEELGYPKE